MRIFVNHIGLDYSVEGEGRPLILLHGNGEDRHIFDAGIGYLKPYFKVYSVDSRGHGCSDPVDEYHYADMTEDMHQFVRKMEIVDPIVFGYSDGGIIGLLWASEHPEDIGTLIAAGANTRPETLKGFSVALMKRRNARNPDPLVTMMLTEPHITEEMLARITVPTVIVRASRDCIDEADTDFMVRSIPNSKKYVMKRADHGSYIVGSPRFADIIFKETGLIRATFGHPPLSFIYHPPVMSNGMQHGGSRRCIRARAEGPPLWGG